MVVDLERETGISVGGEDLGNGVDIGSSSEEKKYNENQLFFNQRKWTRFLLLKRLIFFFVSFLNFSLYPLPLVYIPKPN